MDEMINSSNTVFIGNLSWLTNNEELYQFLAHEGDNVLQVQIQRYEDTNRSKGWALAECVDHEAAVRLVNRFNGKEFKSRPLHLRLERIAKYNHEDGAIRIYVGNLAWSTTEADLTTLLQDFQPLECHILTNMYGKSRGFAIVTLCDATSFSSHSSSTKTLTFSSSFSATPSTATTPPCVASLEERKQRADALIAALHNTSFQDRVLEVRFDRGSSNNASQKDENSATAAPPGQDGASKRSATSVFVGKLGSLITTDDALKELFVTVLQEKMSRMIGEEGLPDVVVVSAKVQIAANGRSKEWGIVKFQSPKAAKLAVKLMHGHLLRNNQALEVRLDRK